MSPKEIIKNQLATGDALLEMFLKDFSDDDCLRQLPEGGQNVTWIHGHLACSDDWILSKLTGSSYQISEAIHGKYKGGSTVSAAASENLGRAEVEALFKEQRGRTMAAIEAADESKWNDPAPEGIPPFFPTVGSVWGMLATHLYWHFGQVTAIRRMLGKPSAF